MWSCLLCTPHKHQAPLWSPKHDHSQLAAEKQTKKRKKISTTYIWKTDTCFNVSIDYLTQPVDTDVGTVLRAQSAVLHLAGQGEEEVVALSEAVQLAHILIWKEIKQRQKQSVYTHPGMVSSLRGDCAVQTGLIGSNNLSYRPLLCTGPKCSAILGTVCC